MRCRVAKLGALGLCVFASACAGSSPGAGDDAAAAVKAGEVAGEVAAVTTVPEPVPTTGPPRDRRVGDVVPMGVGGSLAVLDTESDLNAGRLFTPDRGQQYYAAEVRGCAGETEQSPSFEPEYFTLRIASGGVSLPTLGVKKPDLRGGNIPPGECLSGWVTFQIPEKAEAVGVAYNGSTVIEWKIPSAGPEAAGGA